MLATFHFLRPWWLCSLIPAIILFIFSLRRCNFGKHDWEKYCDPHLLPHLISGQNQLIIQWFMYLVFGWWVCIIIALSGPTWSLYAQTVYQRNIARVIALDVSQSMNTTDIQPTRLERAKYKILDLLKEITEGQTGMIVFSSSPFVVSPLTRDTNTIASMIPILDSSIVPVQGSNIKDALDKSAQLMNQAGFTQGQIILVTDSKPQADDILEASRLSKDGITLSILGVGGSQGGPIIQSDGSFLNDDKGNVVIATLDSQALNKLATAGGGNYVSFQNSNSDIKELLDNSNLKNPQSEASKKAETHDLWKDEGHWFIWLGIIIGAFVARKGWLERIC